MPLAKKAVAKDYIAAQFKEIKKTIEIFEDMVRSGTIHDDVLQEGISDITELLTSIAEMTKDDRKDSK